MPSFRVALPQRFASLGIVGLCTVAAAQDAVPPATVAQVCPAVVATLMIGKASCTAMLCNMAAPGRGLSGILTAVATRGTALDAASFSAGVAAQLATALKQTGCFNVLDAAGLEETRKEMAALGRPAPPPPAVDYLVRVSVTKAEQVLDESGLLGFKTVTATASMTVDTKVVDAATGAVGEVGVYEATVERKSSGVDLGVYRSNDQAAKRGTPFADVTRDVLAKTASGLAARLAGQPVAARPAAASTQPGPAASAP